MTLTSRAGFLGKSCVVPTAGADASARLGRGELIVPVQAGDRFVSAVDGQGDVDAVATDPRHDARDHPVTKPDVYPVAGV
jgi:hypothetical protein